MEVIIGQKQTHYITPVQGGEGLIGQEKILHNTCLTHDVTVYITIIIIPPKTIIEVNTMFRPIKVVRLADPPMRIHDWSSDSPKPLPLSAYTFTSNPVGSHSPCLIIEIEHFTANIMRLNGYSNPILTD